MVSDALLPSKENLIILTFSPNFPSDFEASFPTTNSSAVHTGDKLSHAPLLNQPRWQARNGICFQGACPSHLCLFRECPLVGAQLSWHQLLCMRACSVVSDSAIPWTAACQAPLSMEVSRQDYWSGLPFPPPGALPHPGIKPASLASPALQYSSGTKHELVWTPEDTVCAPQQDCLYQTPATLEEFPGHHISDQLGSEI